MKCVVNYFELLIYYCIWASAIILAFCKYFVAQNEIFRNNPYLRSSLRDLTPGWSFLDREKDISDIEWSCWKYYIQTSWLYLMFQFLISETLRKININISLVKSWYFISSIFFIILFMGTKQLAFILIQPIIFFSLIVCGGKQISIWITSLVLLCSYNMLKYKSYFWQFLDDGNSQDEKVFLLLFAMAWIELRCISFCLDYVERQEVIKSDEKCHDHSQGNLFQIFINMFSYVLYSPLLYLGPIMLYEEFENSFLYKTEKIWTRLKRFSVDIILFVTYSFLLELVLHYIYFCAMHNELKLLKQLPTLALSGGGLWMGFQFHAKYVISYGTTTAFARLDNMVPPPTPRCIARIHIYSQMWRYFDVGLYQFLVKYIYKPGYSTLCKYMNLSKILYKLIASFCTFTFIFLWHGTALNIFIWSVLNYCGILLEHSAKAISTTESYNYFKTKVLKTEAMEVRFIAGICAPLLAVSVISNFYLFGGTEVGNMYVALLNWPAPHNLMIVLISTYCCCHVSMALRDVPSRTDVKIYRTHIKAA